MIIATTLAGPGAENGIEDALRSAAPLVDQFLIIFAGCDPELTRQTVARVSADVGKLALAQHLEWPKDYGKARNYALLAAERAGADWAMTVDCDERFDIDPAALSVLRTTEFDAVSVTDRDLDYQKPRFIRCGAGAEWWGEVHERLTVKACGGAQGWIEGRFWELPKSAEAEGRRLQRGLEACPRMLAQRDDPSIRRHFAECLMGAGRNHEAVEQFSIVLDHPATPLHEQTWCRYRLSEFHAVDGRYEDARQIASYALARDPGFIQELGWVLAHCAAKLREFQTAALWATYALQAPIDYSRGGHRGSTWRQGCTELLARIQEAAERQTQRAMTAENFQAREDYRGDYATLAMALISSLPFADHLDLGAGNGLLVEAMRANHVPSTGFELSEEARASCRVPEHMRFGIDVDGWQAQATRHRHQLVSCVEVLEHMPAERAEAAVRAICANSSLWIYFSAARPGQGGVGHVNEQQPEYWIALFERHGFQLDPTTEWLRGRLANLQRCWWLTNNALIFRRIGAEG